MVYDHPQHAMLVSGRYPLLLPAEVAFKKSAKRFLVKMCSQKKLTFTIIIAPEKMMGKEGTRFFFLNVSGFLGDMLNFVWGPIYW